MNDELLRYLIDLFEKTSPQLWEIAMRQVWVYNIENALILIFLGLIATRLLKINPTKEWKMLNELDDDHEGLHMLMIIFFIVGWGALFICVPILIGSLITGLVNPQYAAIYNLLELIKK